MSEDRLPTDFMINAQIRIAARDNVPIVVRRRGDSSSGTIILKINKLDGMARVLSQVRFNNELVWSPVSRMDPMSDAEAENHLEKQAQMDPDCWLIEIEDKQGRHWFPGKIISL